MIPSFEFATAGRIAFGSGARRSLGGIVAQLGRRVLVVGGSSGRHDDWLAPLLAEHGLVRADFAVTGEPTLDTARAGAAAARAAGCEVVLGVGGGSVLDAAKAIAALATQPGDVLEYLEVIGKGTPLAARPLPCVAVPTTAGTGSEVTRNAVLASPGHAVKVSLRSPAMLPRAAVVDPELTLSLPPALTAATGLDALSQLIEPFVSARRQPLTDAVCREGLTCVAWALRRAFDAPADLAAREAMSLASLCGGIALANAGLGAVHGFAGPIGGMFPAPHGAVCAILLAGVMEANIAAARDLGDEDTVSRYAEIARLLTGHAAVGPDDGAAWVRRLVADLAIPPLAAYGMTTADIPEVVAKAKQASSMKGNPVALTDDALNAILAGAIAPVAG
ncbi:MAG: iron-containing alcohol dehydrogenase [Planctomycetota bacterium]